MPLLELRSVSRTYARGGGLFQAPTPVHALSDVSLSVARGKILGIVGESGCGKSTTGRIALGLEAPDGGEVLFDGAPMPPEGSAAWRALRRRMQLVFQDPLGALDKRMSVAAQIAEPLEIHAIGTQETRAARVAELLRAVGLRPDQGEAQPLALSGGQRQRVVLARALASEPELLVCDEPVSALDVSIQAQVVNILLGLQRQLNLAMLFISHDLKLVGTIADEVAVMYLGRVVERGTPAQLFAAPRHPYTQVLVSSIPDPFRTTPRPRLSGEPPDPGNRPSGCAFHPRCARASEHCRRTDPGLSLRADGRAVACHHDLQETPA
ncbi:ATP-binding cassette domain-containing protein [Pseudooceanicola sp. CBS1P-1]|uniref:ATP-binding cassette domain-containing protein n=1 Tax=Pseudooceanicola albus TaxID=2692189 RepID=A0A6L7FXQ3_9RHOB|nr:MULTISPECIES: oligopeptide/dipeptide ABC transporter ATP-binding protein [Pseudooceanicola]MBT9382332.1 ATP-binding cassette domain-containing protein [Pseudooceanicola endophyticus]MXN16874.1 ATP-binding cassette domain-containing protein [Pseudooceanicola albus]